MSAPEGALRMAAKWAEAAEHDLRNAEHTLTLVEDCPLETVCFHAQPCAEKYLKAWLISRAIEFPKTHDLVLLLNLASDRGLTGLGVLDVQALNRFAVETRYPGDWEPFDRKEAERAVGAAKKIREALRGKLEAG